MAAEAYGYKPPEAARFTAPNKTETARESIAANNNVPSNDHGRLISSLGEGFSVSTNKYTPEGWRIIVNKHPIKEIPIPPHSHTANCEAGHSVLSLLVDGRNVITASAKPGPGFLGKTETVGFSPVAAAYHVHEPGGKHDANLIEENGGNVNGLASEANRAKAKYHRHIARVASAIDKGDLNGGQIMTIINEVDREEVEIEELKNTAVIDLEAPDGSNSHFKARIENNRVKLPQSADIFSLDNFRKLKKTLPPPANSDIFEAAV